MFILCFGQQKYYSNTRAREYSIIPAPIDSSPGSPLKYVTGTGVQPALNAVGMETPILNLIGTLTCCGLRASTRAAAGKRNSRKGKARSPHLFILLSSCDALVCVFSPSVSSLKSFRLEITGRADRYTVSGYRSTLKEVKVPLFHRHTHKIDRSNTIYSCSFSSAYDMQWVLKKHITPTRSRS